MVLLASVVVPTLSRPHALAACLDSLRAHGEGLVGELIVSDQSPDDASERVCRGREGVVYLRSRHRGLSRGRNRGAAGAHARWIVFVDDDVTVGPGWGAALRTVLDAPDAPDLLAGRIVVRGSNDPYFGVAGGLRIPLDPRVPGTMWIAGGAAIHVRRSWFERLGGFDEDFGVGSRYGSAEETDLILRLVRAGGRAFYEPSITVFHPPEPSGRRAILRRYLYGVGAGALVRKHLAGPGGGDVADMAVRAMLGPLAACIRDRPGPAGVAAELAGFLGRLRGFAAYRAADPRRAGAGREAG